LRVFLVANGIADFFGEGIEDTFHGELEMGGVVDQFLC